MESHALWDSYSASRAEYDASGPSFSGNFSQSPSASASVPEEAQSDAAPDYAATFLRNLGFANLGDEGGSVEALKDLNGHLREFNQLRREVEMLRQQRHEDALKVAGLDARVAMLEQRLAEEVRESGRLQNTLDGVLGEHRAERSRTLREMTDLKKLAARLKGLDSNHLANYRRLEVDHDKLRDKLAKVQKAPAPAAASKGGAKGGAAAGAAAPSSTVRGISVTDPAPVQQPPKDWSAVTVAEAGAAQARVALLLQENAKLTEALRDVKEQVSDLVAGADGLEAAAASAKALREAEEASAQAKEATTNGIGEAGPSGGDSSNCATCVATKASELAMPASWVCDHVAGPLQGELEDLKARIQTHFATNQSTDDGAEEEATKACGGENLAFGVGEGDSLLKAAESRAAELAERLAAAESIILEQDQLVYAALFSSGGGANRGARKSQGGGWDGDASFEAELNEERVWLASREQALASKENELSEAAVALDLDRLKLEALRVNGQHWSQATSVSSSTTTTPRRPRTTAQTPSSKQQQQQPMMSPMMARTPGWQNSPIALQVPTTPATAQVLKDMGIRVKVASDKKDHSPAGAPFSTPKAYLSPPGPSP